MLKHCLKVSILLGMTLTTWVVMAAAPMLTQRVVCENVQIPLPKQITKEAPPAVETFTYTWTRGNKSGTEERYDPRQLWEADQRLGMWSDEDGNTYELVQPKSVIDSFDRGVDSNYAQPMKHVLKDDYKQNRQKVGKLARKRLPEWLEDWTGKSFEAPQKLRAVGNVSQALFAQASDTVALVFFFKKAPNQPYALIIRSKNGRPEEWKAVLTRAMGGLALGSKFKPAADTPQEGWNTIDGKHYRVLSNLPKSYEKFQRDLLNEMEAMRTVYTKYIPEPKRMKIPTSVIRVFATPEEYHAYAGAGEGWSSGVFSTTHRELVVMGNVDEGSKKEQKENIQQITFHEGTHQYLFSISPPATHIPIWFNEGHATFFETFTVKSTPGVGRKGPTVVGTPNLSYRLETVQRDSRFCTPSGLAQLMAFTPEAFYQGNHRDVAYASAWVLVHWLRTEAPPELATTLNQYYQLICKGKTQEEVGEKIYPPAVLEKISQGLMEFLNKQEYRR